VGEPLQRRGKAKRAHAAPNAITCGCRAIVGPRSRAACSFFTVALADRSSDLLVRPVDRLRRFYRSVRDRHPFETIAICVLPEHLHTVWLLPPVSANDSHAQQAPRGHGACGAFAHPTAGASCSAWASDRHNDREGRRLRRLWPRAQNDAQGIIAGLSPPRVNGVTPFAVKRDIFVSRSPTHGKRCRKQA
jgi:hypothetical protein